MGTQRSSELERALGKTWRPNTAGLEPFVHGRLREALDDTLEATGKGYDVIVTGAARSGLTTMGQILRDEWSAGATIRITGPLPALTGGFIKPEDTWSKILAHITSNEYEAHSTSSDEALVEVLRRRLARDNVGLIVIDHAEHFAQPAPEPGFAEQIELVTSLLNEAKVCTVTLTDGSIGERVKREYQCPGGTRAVHLAGLGRDLTAGCAYTDGGYDERDIADARTLCERVQRLGDPANEMELDERQLRTILNDTSGNIADIVHWTARAMEEAQGWALQWSHFGATRPSERERGLMLVCARHAEDAAWRLAQGSRRKRRDPMKEAREQSERILRRMAEAGAPGSGSRRPG